MRTKEIVVNDPLVYRGLRFYQASFGRTGNVDGLKVAALPEGGVPQEVVLKMSTPVQLDANTTVTLAEFIPDFFIRDNQVFKRSDNPENPAFRLQVKNTATGEESNAVALPRVRPSLTGAESQLPLPVPDPCKWATSPACRSRTEPGQWLVWAGCLLMGAGLFVAFYMVHMRLWITAMPDARWQAGACGSADRPTRTRTASSRSSTTVVEEIRTELDRALNRTSLCATQGRSAELTLVSAK